RGGGGGGPPEPPGRPPPRWAATQSAARETHPRMPSLDRLRHRARPPREQEQAEGERHDVAVGRTELEASDMPRDDDRLDQPERDSRPQRTPRVEPDNGCGDQ